MPGIPSMGGTELLIVLVIILLFFGATRVPELARSLGQSMREFRKGSSEGPDEAKTLDEQKEKEKPLLEEEARSTEYKEASTREEESSRAAEPPTTRSANGRGGYY
jgi:sec-independent protein translocase protein TatA